MSLPSRQGDEHLWAESNGGEEARIRATDAWASAMSSLKSSVPAAETLASGWKNHNLLLKCMGGAFDNLLRLIKDKNTTPERTQMAKSALLGLVSILHWFGARGAVNSWDVALPTGLLSQTIAIGDLQMLCRLATILTEAPPKFRWIMGVRVAASPGFTKAIEGLLSPLERPGETEAAGYTLSLALQACKAIASFTIWPGEGEQSVAERFADTVLGPLALREIMADPGRIPYSDRLLFLFAAEPEVPRRWGVEWLDEALKALCSVERSCALFNLLGAWGDRMTAAQLGQGARFVHGLLSDPGSLESLVDAHPYALGIIALHLLRCPVDFSLVQPSLLDMARTAALEPLGPLTGERPCREQTKQVMAALLLAAACLADHEVQASVFESLVLPECLSLTSAMVQAPTSQQSRIPDLHVGKYACWVLMLAAAPRTPEWLDVLELLGPQRLLNDDICLDELAHKPSKPPAFLGPFISALRDSWTFAW